MLLLFKAFHIIGFVAWFAGLFYLVRMFVYHVESALKPEPERGILTAQYALMERRVYRIICTPAMVITWMFGLGMLGHYGWMWLAANGNWMYPKLALLLGLTVYHFWSGGLIRRLGSGSIPYTSFQFRLLNEVPTLFLVAIVLLAVFRNTLDVVLAFLGLLLFGQLLYAGARLYRRQRVKKEG